MSLVSKFILSWWRKHALKKTRQLWLAVICVDWTSHPQWPCSHLKLLLCDKAMTWQGDSRIEMNESSQCPPNRGGRFYLAWFVGLFVFFFFGPETSEAFPDKYVSRNCDLSYVSIYIHSFSSFLAFDLPLPPPQIWLNMVVAESFPSNTRGKRKFWTWGGRWRLHSPERVVHGNAVPDLNFMASNCILFSMDQLSCKHLFVLSCIMYIVTAFPTTVSEALGNKS